MLQYRFEAKNKINLGLLIQVADFFSADGIHNFLYKYIDMFTSLLRK